MLDREKNVADDQVQLAIATLNGDYRSGVACVRRNAGDVRYTGDGEGDRVGPNTILQNLSVS